MGLSAVAILVVIAAVAAVAASVVMVALEAAEDREEEVVDFEEVAVADGDVGRFRERRLTSRRAGRGSFGEVSREGMTLERSRPRIKSCIHRLRRFFTASV